MQQGYDLIGDIHGCGETLIKLLEQMGYSKKNGVYQHPKRKALFLGDIVDRGPHIRLACHVVRDMVDGGYADIVMGNHEYNLVTYLTEAPPGIRQPYLRPHTPRNTFIVEQTLEQFANYPHEFNEFLDWFLTIPLFREYENFRVVHACWDLDMIPEYLERYGTNLIRKDMLAESVQTDSFLYQFPAGAGWAPAGWSHHHLERWHGAQVLPCEILGDGPAALSGCGVPAGPTAG